jgi:hypothetical protein
MRYSHPGYPKSLARHLADSRCVIGVVLLSVSLIFLITAAHAEAYHRWAVITSGTPEEQTFSDLLLGELTKVPDLELVERAELEKLAGEQALSIALSPEGSASRLKLGRMLRADALVLTKLTGTQENRELQIIVSECQSGARLRVEGLPWTAENLPLLVEHARNLVHNTRTRFRAGITRVYGVPSFVSQSLSRDYDPLQAQYARLIENALSLQPGTAVIETAEARALGRELALGEGLELRRFVPLFITGEFRVEPRPDAEATVSVTVKLSDGAKTLNTIASGILPLSAAPGWIADTLPTKIQAGTNVLKALTLEEQFHALTGQADAFARLGSLDHAIPLREAALLLDPKSVAQHLLVIDESRRVCSRDGLPALLRAKYQYTADVEAAFNERLQAGIVVLEHFELLIRNRLIDAGQAVKLTSVMSELAFRVSDLSAAASLGKHPPEKDEHFGRFKAELRRFMTEVAPLIPSLPADPQTAGDKYARYQLLNQWQDRLLTAARCGIDSKQLNMDHLAFYRQVMLTTIPDGLEMLFNLPDSYREVSSLFAADVSESDYMQFIRSLTESDHRVARVFAEYVLLKHRYELAHAAGDGQALQVLLAEGGALLEIYRQLPYLGPTSMQRTRERRYQYLEKLMRTIAMELTAPAGKTVTASQEDTGAVIFTPVALKMIEMETRNEIPFHINPPSSSLPCGNDFDIFWANNVLYLHRTAGLLERVFFDNNDAPNAPLIDDVAWDGMRIWVATRKGGVWVLDTNGKIIRTISAGEGLPPAEKGIRLHVLAPGKVLVIGSFGWESRAWCATVAWGGIGDNAPAVNVFHEARRVPLPEDQQQLQLFARDPSAVFSPRWLCELPSLGSAAGPVLLVGRDDLGRLAYREPLMIDLTTLRVDVLRLNFGHTRYRHPHLAYHVIDGNLIGYGLDDRIDRLRPAMFDLKSIDQTVEKPYRFILVADAGPDYAQKPDSELMACVLGGELMVPAGGWLYIPGKQWWRINEETLVGQQLTRGTLPAPYAALRTLNVSALLGLMAWGQYHYYQVTIDETKIPQAGE